MSTRWSTEHIFISKAIHSASYKSAWLRDRRRYVTHGYEYRIIAVTPQDFKNTYARFMTISLKRVFLLKCILHLSVRNSHADTMT